MKRAASQSSSTKDNISLSVEISADTNHYTAANPANNLILNVIHILTWDRGLVKGTMQLADGHLGQQASAKIKIS